MCVWLVPGMWSPAHLRVHGGWVCLEEGGAGHRSQPAHVLTWPLWCLV